MTSPTFGWLAHDDGERRRMMEVIDLFRERGTLDELGIGTIRDTFAEHFFPGTSTIQTRARYFLFIPWMYLQIEEERVPSSSAGRRARELHTQLVTSLKNGGVGTNAGLIGIDAGDALQRLPSAIYWYGLSRWGIRLFPGSTDRYHASLDAYYREERVARASDGGELINPARHSWLPSIPARPEGLLDATTFDLTATEADFLIERVRRSAPDSLLAACLTPQTTRKASAKAPWDIGIDTLPQRLRDDIEHARLFSLVMEGAALLYNRLLAEASAVHFAAADTARIDRYGTALGRWAADMAAEGDALAEWGQEDMWGRLMELEPGIPYKAREFSRQWIERARMDPGTVVDDPAARELIRYRERQTKGALARLHNERALERWSGASSLGRLTYRWDQAKGIVTDILRGAQQGTELLDRLPSSSEVRIRPAVAALPSITPVGMAALHPGAVGSFSVVTENGKFGSSIEDVFLPDVAARRKYAASRIPALVDMTLGDILTWSKTKLAAQVAGAEVVIVRSQEIDNAGEGGFAHQARQTMDSVIDNLASAIRRLGNAGIERVVLSADHGYLFAHGDRDDSMKVDPPGGATVELHRRCWIGRGGATPAGTLRVSGADLGYQSDLEFIFPRGAGVFRAGGDLGYHHGGTTLQEMVVPVITVRTAPADTADGGKKKIEVSNLPYEITNRVFTVTISAGGANLALFAEPVVVRPVLLDGSDQVGKVGMVPDGTWDEAAGTLSLLPGKPATVVFLLGDADAGSIRVVVRDPATDAELYRSPADIPINFGVG